VGKTFFLVPGLDEKKIRAEFSTECVKAGDYLLLKTPLPPGRTSTTPTIPSPSSPSSSLQVWGAAFKSTDTVKVPIYVSIGHKISLETAIRVCKVGSRSDGSKPLKEDNN